MVGLCEMGYKECFNTTLYCFKKVTNMKEMEIRRELEKRNKE